MKDCFFNKETSSAVIKLEASTPAELEALKWFLRLSQQGKMAQLKFRYQDWYTDQQKELQRALA